MKRNRLRTGWFGAISSPFDWLMVRSLGKSARREPLFLEMLGYGLGRGPVTMISVGSSDGIESLYALRRKRRDVTVHLLEPDPVNREVCRRNISARFPNADRVHFHDLAVSNRTAEGSFFRNPETPNLNSAARAGGACEEFNVRYVTLDHFLESNRIQAPVIVTMDIEGHEVEVLEGFLGFAAANRGVRILLEVHPGLYSPQHSLERILQKYFDSGYRTAYLESAGVPVPQKFKERSLRPVKVIKDRGLYAGPDDEFVLDAACHEHLNPVDQTGRVTRKIVRSLLLERD